MNSERRGFIKRAIGGMLGLLGLSSVRASGARNPQDVLYMGAKPAGQRQFIDLLRVTEHSTTMFNEHGQPNGCRQFGWYEFRSVADMDRALGVISPTLAPGHRRESTLIQRDLFKAELFIETRDKPIIS